MYFYQPNINGMKKTLTIILLGLVAYTGSYAQDVHFSQFYNAPMVTNPALTGAFNAEHRIIANYRGQWGSIDKPYTTYALSYDCGFLKNTISSGFPAIGLQFYADKAGDLKMGIIQINLNLAYHLALNKNHFLTAGIEGGYSQRSLNGTDMRWDSQYDPLAEEGFNANLPSNETSGFKSFGFADFGAGLLWTFNNGSTNMSSNDQIKGNLGVALFHLNRPKKNFTNFEPKSMFIKTTIHANVHFGIPNTNLAIVPSFLCELQGPAREILLGSLFRFRLQEKSKYTNFVSETALSIGVHYRFGDAIIATGMFEWKNYALGISYDVNTSKLSAATKSMGGLEIALRYQTPIFKKSDKSLY